MMLDRGGKPARQEMTQQRQAEIITFRMFLTEFLRQF